MERAVEIILTKNILEIMGLFCLFWISEALFWLSLFLLLLLLFPPMWTWGHNAVFTQTTNRSPSDPVLEQAVTDEPPHSNLLPISSLCRNGWTVNQVTSEITGGCSACYLSATTSVFIHKGQVFARAWYKAAAQFSEILRPPKIRIKGVTTHPAIMVPCSCM